MSLDLYVARHGQTVSNIEYRLLGGGGDSPLTPKGIEQARALGEVLSEARLQFDTFYVSPLERARKTLEYALGAAGIAKTPVIDPRLAEINFGAMHDMLPEEAKRFYPKAAGNMLAAPENYEPPPGGESIASAMARVNSFLEEILQENSQRENNNIFVLTHGFMMRIFHTCTVGGGISAIGKVARYENCDLCHYRYNDAWMLADEKRNHTDDRIKKY